MTFRPLLTAVLATAIYAVILVGTASAEQHRVRVTLANGDVVTLTLDVAQGATATLAQLPPLPSPPTSIEDLGPDPGADGRPDAPASAGSDPTPTVPNLPVPTPTGTPANPGTPSTPQNPVTGGGQPSRRRADDGPGRAGEGHGEPGGREHRNPQGRGEEEGAQGSRARATPRPTPAPGRNIDGTPTIDNPTFSLVDARRRADRRPELLHRQVPDPAVPALDLPGRRHPVRHPLGDPRGDQRDRDRLRPQPEHLLGRRARLDAVHAGHLEDVRRRRQPGRQEGSRSTRSTRSSPPRATCAPPAATRTSRRRSSPTTTPTGTSTPSSCARV